jgi:alginate O-acetyltransferase complex protein AlgI
MLFNSFDFLFFLPIVFLLYWFVFSKSKITQNVFLLIASYVFYSFWDWRFSFLLAFSTILDYTLGLIIDKAKTIQRKKCWMRLSIITNIGLLCYFKYFNFFIDSFIKLVNHFGVHADPYTLNIILPIGISFYTFHGVSYVLDIYYGRIKAHKNIIDYSLFVSYFPLLVAGPIERATHLLLQLKGKREFKYSQGVEGCRLMLWGLFKKVVIADNIAPFVNDIFSNYQNYTGIELIIGTIGFAFQVYGDFSGYSDIARGVSKLLGIELIVNFNFPFFSKSIPEFWSRWHISLSLWLNDYVFTPLALNLRHYGKHGMFLAVFITFILAGLWHGAAWHFVFYGAYFGLLYVPNIFSQQGIKSMVNKKNQSLYISNLLQILLTFAQVCIGFVFFRSRDLTSAFLYFQKIFISLINDVSQFQSIPKGKLIILLVFIFLSIEWLLIKITSNDNYYIPTFVRRICYFICGACVYWFIESNLKEFIYFQF